MSANDIMEPVRHPRFQTREGAKFHLAAYGWIQRDTALPSWMHPELPGVTRFISRDRSGYNLVYFLEQRPWEEEKRRIQAEVDPEFVLLPPRGFPTPHVSSHQRSI